MARYTPTYAHLPSHVAGHAYTDPAMSTEDYLCPVGGCGWRCQSLDDNLQPVSRAYRAVALYNHMLHAHTEKEIDKVNPKAMEEKDMRIRLVAMLEIEEPFKSNATMEKAVLQHWDSMPVNRSHNGLQVLLSSFKGITNDSINLIVAAVFDPVLIHGSPEAIADPTLTRRKVVRSPGVKDNGGPSSSDN